jgi:hypothetical protein
VFWKRLEFKTQRSKLYLLLNFFGKCFWGQRGTIVEAQLWRCNCEGAVEEVQLKRCNFGGEIEACKIIFYKTSVFSPH